MLLAALLATVTVACPTERAQYRLSSDASVTAEFFPVPRTADWAGGVALRVRFGKTGRSYWFVPWQGGTDGRTNMAWVRERGDPIAGQSVREGIEIVTTDADHRIHEAIPRATRPAPRHILLLGLRTLTWYRTPHDRRDDARRGFFDRTGCRPATVRAYRPSIDFPPIP